MSFSCETCNYTTSKKINLKRHIQTKKHIILSNKNKKKFTCICNKEYKYYQSLLRHLNSCALLNNNNITCLFCNRSFKHQSSLSRHKEKCREDYRLKYEINKCNITNNITNNIIFHNNNIVNFIINKYPNAPNLELNESISFNDKNMRKYIDQGIPDGAIEFINDTWIKDKKINEMSFWCVDPSRSKCIVRINDKWKVDMKGDITKDTIMPYIKNKFLVFIAKENEKISLIKNKSIDDLKKMQKNNNFLYDLIDKEKQKKIMKNVMNKIIFKNTF